MGLFSYLYYNLLLGFFSFYVSLDYTDKFYFFFHFFKYCVIIIAMPKMTIKPTPIARPSTPGVTIRANDTQKFKTGQSPNRPSTTHQIPSVGVIQIEHKPTSQKLILSTADVKKTLTQFFNTVAFETMGLPMIVDCYNGGSGTTITTKGGGGGGKVTWTNGTKPPIRGGGGTNNNLVICPPYNDLTPVLPTPHFPPPPKPNQPQVIGCFGGPVQGPSFNIVRPSVTKGAPSKIKGTSSGGGGVYTLPVIRPGPKPPVPGRGEIRPLPVRPSNKENWDVNWLCRYDKGTLPMTDLIKYEIALKNAIQPTLNGDRANSAATFTLPDGSSITTNYNFCGTKPGVRGGFCGTPGGPRPLPVPTPPSPLPTPPPIPKVPAFCSTPSRGGGGIGGKPVYTGGRGGYVKQSGGGVVPNSAGQAISMPAGGPGACCSSPAGAPTGLTQVKPYSPGPYADLQGGRRPNPKPVRCLEKSVVKNCWDRNKYESSLPEISKYQAEVKLWEKPMPGGENLFFPGSRADGRAPKIKASLKVR